MMIIRELSLRQVYVKKHEGVKRSLHGKERVGEEPKESIIQSSTVF